MMFGKQSIFRPRSVRNRIRTANVASEREAGEHTSTLLPVRLRGDEPRSARDPVDITSEDSFPASDPPAWTGSEAGGLQREVGGS